MRKLLIGGRFEDSATGARLEVVDPATEEVVDIVPRGGPADIDRAVAAAKAAFPGWKRTPAWTRAGLLVEAARRLRQNQEEFAVTLTRDDRPDDALVLIMERRTPFTWKLAGVDLTPDPMG